MYLRWCIAQGIPQGVYPSWLYLRVCIPPGYTSQVCTSRVYLSGVYQGGYASSRVTRVGMPLPVLPGWLGTSCCCTRWLGPLLLLYPVGRCTPVVPGGYVHPVVPGGYAGYVPPCICTPVGMVGGTPPWYMPTLHPGYTSVLTMPTTGTMVSMLGTTMRGERLPGSGKEVYPGWEPLPVLNLPKV